MPPRPTTAAAPPGSPGSALLTAALLLLLLVCPAPAQARHLTYCVGGYRGLYPDIQDTACNREPIRAQHGRWHHHIFFVRIADGLCFDCWDEHDSSCDWDFQNRNPGYRRVRTPDRDCHTQDTSQEIIDHIINGQPDPAIERTQIPATALTPTAQATTEDGRPLSAGEDATLIGTIRDPDGNLRPLDGGHFRIVAPDGTVQEVAGQLQPDGTTVQAHATLPDADAVQITFIPELAALAPGEAVQPGDTGSSLALRGTPAFPDLLPLDFGTLTAGAALRAHCQELDLRGARNLEGRAIDLSLAGLEGCTARPLLATRDASGEIDQLRPLEPAPLHLDTVPTTLTLCLSVPLCSGEQAPADAVLRLTPAGHPAKAAAVPLRWSITGRSWLACNGIWLGPLLATLAAGWLVLGFIRPRRFPTGATIAVASSPEGLRRAAPVPLRECRGARPGFYRDACLAVHFDGAVHGRQRGAAALLRASREGVALLPRGTLEIYDRRKRQWKPASSGEGAAPTLLPTPGEIFRCGDVCFQIDPG